MAEPLEKNDPIFNVLLGLLIFTGFTSALIIEGPSFSLSLSQILAPLIFLAMVLYSALNSRQFIVLYKDRLSVLIYLYFFCNLFSSVVFSPDVYESLKGSAVIFSYVFLYASFRWMLKFVRDHQAVLRKLLRMNLLSAVFGLSCMALSFLTHEENIGVSFGHLAQSGIDILQGPIPSIRSLSIEPNIFAIITAAILCLNIAIYFLWYKSATRLVTIAILSMAVLFSYTRSVYISLTVALVAVMVFSGRIRLVFLLLSYGMMVCVMVVVTFLLLPDDSEVKMVLASRVASLVDFESGSGAGRLEGYRMGFEGFLNSPVFGNGTLSANTSFYNPYTRAEQEIMGSAGWLNGAFIQSLHDTGIVGAVITLAIFVSAILANYRIMKQLNNDTIWRSVALGFIGGNTVLFISSQLSSTLWISFPYIYWAINMAFIAECKGMIERQRMAASMANASIEE